MYHTHTGNPVVITCIQRSENEVIKFFYSRMPRGAFGGDCKPLTISEAGQLKFRFANRAREGKEEWREKRNPFVAWPHMFRLSSALRRIQIPFRSAWRLDKVREGV